MIRISMDNAPDFAFFKKLHGIVLDVQGDTCAGRLLVFYFGDLEGALAIRTPLEAVVRSGPFRYHIDALRHHEGRIKANAELTNQVRTRAFLFFAFLDLVDKGLCSRAGNGSQIFHQLLFAHANAIVGQRQGPGGLVECEGYRQLVIIADQRFISQSFIAQFVEGIGTVRDQLAQEHFPLGINGMHH